MATITDVYCILNYYKAGLSGKDTPLRFEKEIADFSDADNLALVCNRARGVEPMRKLNFYFLRETLSNVYGIMTPTSCNEDYKLAQRFDHGVRTS